MGTLIASGWQLHPIRMRRTASDRGDYRDRTFVIHRSGRRLGISRAALHGWLAASDAGTFAIRGEPVSIQYFQGGPRGEGRIRLEASEVERLLELMKVHPRPQRTRQLPKQRRGLQHIRGNLGRPDD